MRREHPRGVVREEREELYAKRNTKKESTVPHYYLSEIELASLRLPLHLLSQPFRNTF